MEEEPVRWDDDEDVLLVSCERTRRSSSSHSASLVPLTEQGSQVSRVSHMSHTCVGRSMGLFRIMPYPSAKNEPTVSQPVAPALGSSVVHLAPNVSDLVRMSDTAVL